MEGVLFLLGIEVGNDGIAPAEVLILDTGGHDHHHADCDNQQHRAAGQHLRYAPGVQQAAQAHAGDDAPDGQGHAPCEAGHELVVPGGVLHPALLHAAPEQSVQIYVIQVADAQQGVHLRKALAALPLADRLAGDLQLFRQLLLGDAGLSADEL